MFLSIASIKAAMEKVKEEECFLEQKQVEVKAKRAAEEAMELNISCMMFEFS
jgi:hypothetical protein